MKNNKQEIHLVTGGGGYAGYQLGKSLKDKGYQVVLFDIQKLQDSLQNGMTFFQGDICNIEDVEKAAESCSHIYHLASYGMSGREQLNHKKIEDVNINGTKNVIKVCCKLGIEYLVYTSTYNVVFGGQVIENGDESLPYFPLNRHPDHYSCTKSIAEQEVLKANGTVMNDGKILKTCALRLAGVYGPGEQRHLPRIMSYVERGFFLIKYGAEDCKVDFLHVENLVQAHILAAEALTNDHNNIATGEAYFISDGKPINNFEFFKPMIEDLGFTYPKRTVPLSMVYFIAYLIELVHCVIGRIYNFQPLLTRTEVYKTGVTHFFSIEKARQHLSYNPTFQNDLKEATKWFKDRGHYRKNTSSRSWWSVLLDILLAILFAILIMSFLPMVV